jgi:hypothetical protein
MAPDLPLAPCGERDDRDARAAGSSATNWYVHLPNAAIDGPSTGHAAILQLSTSAGLLYPFFGIHERDGRDEQHDGHEVTAHDVGKREGGAGVEPPDALSCPLQTGCPGVKRRCRSATSTPVTLRDCGNFAYLECPGEVRNVLNGFVRRTKHGS